MKNAVMAHLYKEDPTRRRKGQIVLKNDDVWIRKFHTNTPEIAYKMIPVIFMRSFYRPWDIIYDIKYVLHLCFGNVPISYTVQQ